ncbi:IS1634 family transposase [Ktedonobacter racemifer]|uniref:IS1634 family transposase n=1 Tax=Ktedonobacter racemifer TaxID=363277 RepID=UPI00058D6C26|nr:IS1634 family transposase [Ktedonobacter racemifer]
MRNVICQGAESGGYSEANMKRYNEANIRWISRVPGTFTEAKEAVQEEPGVWHLFADGSGKYSARIMDLPQGKERWVIIHTDAGEQAARVQMEKKVRNSQEQWEKRLWHLSTQNFACEKDAQHVWQQTLKGKPSYLVATFTLREEGRYQHKGRPKKDASPETTVWYLTPTLLVDQGEVEAQIKQQARFLVATNVIEEQDLSHEQIFHTYKEQGGVERGFRFLKDPLFLASSIFVKKPERIMALSFIMVLCLLVYRLAEQLLRHQLVQAEQTFPNQLNKPTNRPTMRWMFQCFEGIDLLYIRMGSRFQTQILGLQALHRQVLALLGPAYSQCYLFSP